MRCDTNAPKKWKVTGQGRDNGRHEAATPGQRWERCKLALQDLTWYCSAINSDVRLSEGSMKLPVDRDDGLVFKACTVPPPTNQFRRDVAIPTPGSLMAARFPNPSSPLGRGVVTVPLGVFSDAPMRWVVALDVILHPKLQNVPKSSLETLPDLSCSSLSDSTLSAAISTLNWPRADDDAGCFHL